MVSQVYPRTHNAVPVQSPPTTTTSATSTSPPDPKMDLTAVEAALREYQAKNERPPSQTMWHVHNRWGLFAWIEFGLKIGGCLTIFINLTTISTNVKVSLLRIVEIVLFVPLILGLIIPLMSAYQQRESFNFFYVVACFFAHIAVIFVLLYGKTGISMIVFCTLMAVGEFFRLVFLEATPARKLPPTFTAGRRRALIGFVFMYIVVYLVVSAMETLTVIDDNKEYISPDVIGF